MKKKKKLVYNLLFTICLVVFLYSGYRLIAYYFEYKSMNDVYADINADVVGDFKFNINTEDLISQAPDVDMNALLDINREICGYILIPDTKVAYPIAYSTDELKYLNYNIYNNRSRAGSIFVEPADNPDFTDSSVLIHGHNMIDDSMFGELNKYVEDEQFFKDHPYIYIVTTDNTYLYRIFSVDTININDGVYRLSFNSNASLNDYVTERLNASEFPPEIIPEDVTHMITLSTCSNYGDDLRTLVQAYLIDTKN